MTDSGDDDAAAAAAAERFDPDPPVIPSPVPSVIIRWNESAPGSRADVPCPPRSPSPPLPALRMLASDPIPVAALAELARCRGLGSDAVRARAWPALLALGVDRPANGDDVYERRASSLSQKDANQVTLDVNRSHWIRGDPALSPLSPVSQTTNPSGQARAKLARLIQGVVGSHAGRSHYYQGLHDVAAILQTALAPTTDLTGAAIERLTLGHLRDCVQGGLGAVMDTLRLLPHLIAVADPELHAALFPPSNRSSFGAAKPPANDSIAAGGEAGSVDAGSADGGSADGGRADAGEGDSFVVLGVADLSDMEHIVGCHFAVSWLLTWFSHGLDDYATAARLFDLFLASDPLIPLYVGAAAIVKDRDELLAMARGSNLGSNLGSNRLDERAPIIEGLLHMRLQRLPALTDAGVPRADSVFNPVDVEVDDDDDDDGRAKRARVTVTVDDENARVRVEVSDASEDAASTPVTHRPVTHRPDGWGVGAVVRAALELHARIPPASLYTVLGVVPDPAGAFASYPYPWLRDAGFEVSDDFSKDGDSRGSKRGPTDAGRADEGVFPADGRVAAAFPCGRRWYAGDVSHGRRHGLGRHVDAASSDPASTNEGFERYEGEWRMGLRHGLGCAVFPDGARYAGEWSEGYMDGWGTYTWPAPGSASYAGSFRANERSGLGIVTHADRRIDAGVWRAGRLETPMSASHVRGGPSGEGRGEGESSTSMTATMRAAASAAAAASIDAAAAASSARELADAIAAGDASAGPFPTPRWGGAADTWPWPETRALVWPPPTEAPPTEGANVPVHPPSSAPPARVPAPDNAPARATRPTTTTTRRARAAAADETFHFRGLGNNRGWTPARLGARIRRGVTDGVREAKGALDDLRESEGVRHVRGFMGRLGIGGRGGGGGDASDPR